MSDKDELKEVRLLKVDKATQTLVPFDDDASEDEGEGGGSAWWEDDGTRVKFVDPFKNYELLSELSKHHQYYAEFVQAAIEPDRDAKKNISNNFGIEHQSEFLPHPLLAGKPYFNGMDPKTTVLPSETELTDAPEYNNAKNELKLQKALRNEKKMQNERKFNPRPDGM